ncbi:MAG: hypothetical protein JJE02_08515 [Propionibacteriales bacterium]|nr:hypothetical protein [Propionibacteriales bacterium]
MRRFAVAVTTVVLSMAVLVACGGSDYCDSVEKNQKTLNTFGEKRTNEAYAGYAKVFTSIAVQSPKEVRADWTKLAAVTNGVLKAHDSVGLKLEEMNDAKKLATVQPADLTKLNNAYKAFNDTAKERAAVVKNVKQECKITLK